MNIQQIAQKYKISDNFLNSKDDAVLIVAESIKEIKMELDRTTPNKSISEKLEKLMEFCTDIKRSNI
jgi:hypothetical protein